MSQYEEIQKQYQEYLSGKIPVTEEILNDSTLKIKEKDWDDPSQFKSMSDILKKILHDSILKLNEKSWEDGPKIEDINNMFKKSINKDISDWDVFIDMNNMFKKIKSTYDIRISKL